MSATPEFGFDPATIAYDSSGVISYSVSSVLALSQSFSVRNALLATGATDACLNKTVCTLPNKRGL